MNRFFKSLSTVFFIVALTGLLWSCEDTEIQNQPTEDQPDAVMELEHSSKEQLKRAFATSLAKSVAESKSLRQLIKEQSLRKFDNDYDILYELVKNEPVEDGRTLQQLLEQNLASAFDLSLIEKELPTLTIFVPSLPNDAFSAEVWDVDAQIPLVGYNVKSSNHVPIIRNDGSGYVLEDYLIPTYPVIVVKENERVVVSDQIGARGTSSRISASSSFQSEDGVQFNFLDDCFNAALNGEREQARQSETAIDPKLIAAYDVFEGTTGWQRDHVYYGLTPTSDRGPFSYDFQEHITSFRMLGGSGWERGVRAYNKIADQTGDPRIGIRYRYGYPETYGSWTDGIFEFKVIALVNGKNGVGAQFITYFPAPPRDLFRIRISTPQGEDYNTVRLRNLRVKRLYVNLPLVKWDLDQYASSIKIEVEEVDRTETITTTDTRVVKFAQNFGFDLGFGEKVKIGLKFGADLEQTQTSSVTKAYSLANDKLGSVIMNFADNCVRKNYNDTYSAGTRYSTGWFELDLAPKRVQ
ncbi:MAG: hypothetical protein AAGA66_21150 [Bacteroidota bacterium]